MVAAETVAARAPKSCLPPRVAAAAKDSLESGTTTELCLSNSSSEAAVADDGGWYTALQRLIRVGGGDGVLGTHALRRPACSGPILDECSIFRDDGDLVIAGGTALTTFADATGASHINALVKRFP